MDKHFPYEKSLKKWLNDLPLSKERISSVDENIASLLVLAISARTPQKILLEVPGFALGEKIRNEMEVWARFLGLELSAAVLPDGTSCEKRLAESEIPRAQLLDRVLNDPPRILIVSAAAEMSPAPSPEQMRNSEFTIRKGMELSPEKLAELLVGMDYDDEPEVTQKGEFSRRGGLVDVFSPALDYPVRIEFFGDTVESIRKFSERTQISVGEISDCKLIMRSGSGEEESLRETGNFSDYAKFYSPRVVTLFPEECRGTLERFFSTEIQKSWMRLHEEEPLWKNSLKLLDEAESAKYRPEEVVMSPLFPSAQHILKLIPEGTEENLADLVRQISSSLIRQFSDESYHIMVAGRTEGDVASLEEWLAEEGLTSLPNLGCVHAEIPCGVFLPGPKLAFFSEYELFSSPRRLTRHKTIVNEVSPPEESFPDAIEDSLSADLEEGDHAVHLNYGICIYRGLKTITDKNSTYEALELEFDNDSIVYVPVWQAHCVSRYIGAQKGLVKLSRIGGSRWSKIKAEAAESVRTLALDMLRIHAIRSRAQGTTFPPDDLAQHLFEKAFPFTETKDQLHAAEEIKKDMESPRPMDRLLCGDVGYGKTEVAMRAVFKCVMTGRQAAILVPTTILAQQHYYNFLERFAEYPVIIETLSRFKTKAQQAEIVRRLKEGKADIVIGTHRLLQNDIMFKDLGLVVIDEEQRFGVIHKEKLKNLRTLVDVLTMTATPIPRTLYFSMSGMRDLSTIMSAPVQRIPVQTVVSQYDESIVTAAISRELQRGGQVYYLHNRVQTIDETADRLRVLLPSARIEVGHGQMEEHALEDVMERFIEGKTDVLVCTTIIESGLDIPNANTILIERADRFGLAELYQLRGRVGRWSRQAYAYLLLPGNAILSGDARKRITAMRKYTHLGAGFKLALRDLEIRGAGNILGAEQSGHINAIGFTLYCQLLRTVTAQLKGEETMLRRECNVYLDFVDYAIKAAPGKAPAAFPEEYINSPRLRLDAYRRLAMTSDLFLLEEFRKELSDRFGRLPPPAENLFLCAQIRIIGVQARVNSITCSGGKILMERGQELVKHEGKIPLLPGGCAPESKLRILKGMLEKIFMKKTF
ncbi:MAG: Transcription-repair-coupling factor [Lentisphaerae bacterium ADurb.Bin242]|nr:MAG: Transcription-repair-coupling factor [Lentisphaerae bacterium ADurb.Bin242]